MREYGSLRGPPSNTQCVNFSQTTQGSYEPHPPLQENLITPQNAPQGSGLRSLAISGGAPQPLPARNPDTHSGYGETDNFSVSEYGAGGMRDFPTSYPSQGRMGRPPPPNGPNSGPKFSNTTEGSEFFTRNWQGALEVARQAKPQWDGDPLSWKRFWQEWEYYWSMLEPCLGSNPEYRKMTFLRCLPREASERAKNWITFERISFEDLVARLDEGCTGVVPSFAVAKRWQALVPTSKKWHAVETWFAEFQRMSAEVGTCRRIKNRTI